MLWPDEMRGIPPCPSRLGSIVREMDHARSRTPMSPSHRGHRLRRRSPGSTTAQAGYRVRVLVRDRDRLEGRSWLDRVELVLSDVLDAAMLPTVLDGVDTPTTSIPSAGSCSRGSFAP